MNRTEYTLRNLSKISHKKHELYVISRVVHLLNDPEIEFVCQQLIRAKNGARYLTDLCFPQLKIYYEIDEAQHSSAEHSISDKHRKREIMDASDFREYRIKVYNESDTKLSKGLDKINTQVDEFINIIKTEKDRSVKAGAFKPWDPEKKFDPQVHIDRGYIDVSDNVVFQNHRDAMRCFGYEKGHYQRAVWRIPGDDRNIWFPKLYRNNDWENILSDNFDKITMRSLKGWDITPAGIDKFVVFAHYKNILGQVVYKFLGEFHTSLAESGRDEVNFRLISKKVKLI